MFEPYYHPGDFFESKPRTEACTTAGTVTMFYTKKDSSIVPTDGPMAAMEMASANKRAGFIAVGNYHSVPSLLPADTEPAHVADGAELRATVLSGNLTARFLSEGTPGSDAEVDRLETGIIPPRVILLRKDRAAGCLSYLESGDSSGAQHAYGIALLALLVGLATLLV